MSKDNRQHEPVPRLRFPEFRDSDGWPHVPLGRVAERVTTRNNDESVTRVLTNSAEHGVLDQRDYFDKDIANKRNLDGYYVVNHGDYVYNPRISSVAPVGPISRNNIGQGVMSPLYTVFRFEGSDTDFYQHYFKSTNWHAYVRSVSSMGARHDRMSITNADFMRMPLPNPHQDEQQKVADCLGSLDDLIAAEGQKLEAIRDHKKGLMQQLFPREGETQPRLRFPEFRDAPEWEAEPLESHFELISGFAFPGKDILEGDGDYRLMRGINITEGSVRHSVDIDRFYSGDVSGLERYVLEAGDLVIGMDGSKVGKNSAIVSPEDAGALLVQRVARLRTSDAILLKFTFHQINSAVFHSYVDRVNTSSGIPHISAKQIEDFSIWIPGPAEQERIADCLSTLDTRIAAQAEKLDTLRVHKRGLMQQLFPAPEADGR